MFYTPSYALTTCEKLILIERKTTEKHQSVFVAKLDIEWES
jgi:hypothetical protein